ncbi:MAG TPA: metalloregulator ArsR/SmtB family transcription factor [Chloroflexia bacterium]|nr:metalloregulator ArsR/SmtB family transcription factor [Chloroflexia bacterium]
MSLTLQQFKAELFKALSHPTRIRILELLRDGERTVTDLQSTLQVESSTMSQQLAILRNRNIVDARKEGTSVFYQVRDRAVYDLLDQARFMFQNHLVNLQSIVMEESAPARRGDTAG